MKIIKIHKEKVFKKQNLFNPHRNEDERKIKREKKDLTKIICRCFKISLTASKVNLFSVKNLIFYVVKKFVSDKSGGIFGEFFRKDFCERFGGKKLKIWGHPTFCEMAFFSFIFPLY
jgi:hypothetical protein